MAELQLTDLVLLGTNFQMWPRGGSEPAETGDESVFEYPEGEFIKLSSAASREDGEYVLYLQADLDEKEFPFKLSVLLGARFRASDELSAEKAEKTLVWLCYPYLRELVASVTGRSPLPPYYMPALTRMPDPSVLAAVVEEPDSDA